MEQSYVFCIQQTVRMLAVRFNFDYEEALSHLGMDDLIPAIQLPKGAAGVEVTKPKKFKYPMPFYGEIDSSCCHAIVYNGGLFTQCLKEPNPDSQSTLCKPCERQAEKNEKNKGNPPLGFISERVERGDDWADPKGRQPVPYTKVMMAKQFTQEDVMTQVSQYNLYIDTKHFVEPETEKKGRKKTTKKTEVQPIFEDEGEEGFDGANWEELMQQAKDSESETSESSKATSKKSKKTEEEKEAEKARKAAEKAEKEAAKEAKAAEKAKKAAEKEAAKADKKRAPFKNLKEEKVGENDDTEEVEPLEEVEEPLEVLEEVAAPALSPILEDEDVPPPLPTPPKQAEEKKKSKKSSMKTIVGPDGIKYVYDKNDENKVVYMKENQTERIGVLVNGTIMFDVTQEEEDEEEEDEEDLSENDSDEDSDED